jgi:hypothetical protein
MANVATWPRDSIGLNIFQFLPAKPEKLSRPAQIPG